MGATTVVNIERQSLRGRSTSPAGGADVRVGALQAAIRSGIDSEKTGTVVLIGLVGQSWPAYRGTSFSTAS